MSNIWYKTDDAKHKLGTKNQIRTDNKVKILTMNKRLIGNKFHFIQLHTLHNQLRIENLHVQLIYNLTLHNQLVHYKSYKYKT